MSINLISRQSQVFIGGKQFPFESIVLNDAAWSENGQIPTTGRITLKDTPGFDESLDDRVNPRFWEGQTVEIYTAAADTSGTLQRHPRGALRILTASYQSPTLTLEVGCELAYGARNEPTDPDEAEVQLGTYKAIKDVASTLAQKAGVGIPSIGSVPGYSINYPVGMQGSYLATMGKLLYSINAFAWTRNNGSVRFDPFDETEPIFTAIVGSTAKPPLRLNDPERPPETVRVVGNGVVVKSTSDSDSYIRETYVDGKLYRRLEITTTLSGNIKKRVTHESEKLEGILNGLEVEDHYNLAMLWTKEEKTEIWTFESGDSGKLLKYRMEAYRPFALACRSFVSWHKSNDSAYWNGERFAPALRSDLLGQILAETETTIYDYSIQEQPQKITTETWLTESEILGNTAIDWQEFETRSPSRPSSIRRAAIFEQAWTEIRKGQWEKAETRKESTAIRNPKRYDDAELYTLLQTGFNLGASDEEIRESNSGQEQPPAPERRVPRYVMEQYPVEQEARFTQYGGSHNPRTRTFQIPYLEGQTGIDNPRRNSGTVAVTGSGINGAKLQALQLAQTIGKVLVGRHKGDRVDLPLLDIFFTEHRPLMTFDVQHGAVTRRYLMDAVTWVVTPSETVISTDGIWVGTVVTQGEETILIPPYQVTQQVRGGLRLGGQFIPYVEPPSPPVVMRGGFRIGGLLLLNELEEVLVAGYMICTGECTAGFGGKAVAFPPESYGTYDFLVVPEGLSITAGATAIEVHRWSQEPNTSLAGREWVADLSEEGGMFTVTLDATYHWISIFAKNPSNGDNHDGVCFLWTGNAAMLMAYS